MRAAALLPSWLQTLRSYTGGEARHCLGSVLLSMQQRKFSRAFVKGPVTPFHLH